MSSSDVFEDQLRLEFSMLDVPAPSAGALETAVRRFRRWRLRRRLLVAAPGLVAAASLGAVLGLSGTSDLGSGGIPDSSTIRLANYAFPLPSGFHLTATPTDTCKAEVRFVERFETKPGSAPKSALTDLLHTGAGRYSTEKIASAASADGGCVEMALTKPFTPTAETGNPSYPLTTSSRARRVDVAGYHGWLTTAQTNEGQPTSQLTVELPQADGQMRDLGVGASGLSANALLTIVSHGLS